MKQLLLTRMISTVMSPVKLCKAVEQYKLKFTPLYEAALSFCATKPSVLVAPRGPGKRTADDALYPCEERPLRVNCAAPISVAAWSSL